MSKQPKRKRPMEGASAHASEKRMGRPPVSDQGSERITVRFPTDIIAGIDDIVAERFGQAERSAVVRELVAEALQNRKKR